MDQFWHSHLKTMHSNCLFRKSVSVSYNMRKSTRSIWLLLLWLYYYHYNYYQQQHPPTPTFYCNPNGMHQKRSRGHWFIRALCWMSPSLCLIRPLRKNPNYKFIQNTPFTIKLLPNCVFLLLLRWIGDSCLREIEMTITSIIIISWTNKYRSNYCRFL